MATQFKKGDAVRQKLPAPVQGIVEQFQIDADSGDVHYLIRDAEGHLQTFREDQVEAVSE